MRSQHGDLDFFCGTSCGFSSAGIGAQCVPAAAVAAAGAGFVSQSVPNSMNTAHAESGAGANSARHALNAPRRSRFDIGFSV
jgi:hypothetical protein